MTNASILSILAQDSHTDFKVKSQSHGAGAYCGGDVAAQLVNKDLHVTIRLMVAIHLSTTQFEHTSNSI